jgi:NADH-quinone oxidoreductase subunit B
MLLQKSIGQSRPLGWHLGPEGVSRAPQLSLRDAKRAERAAVTDLRTPDSV